MSKFKLDEDELDRLKALTATDDWKLLVTKLPDFVSYVEQEFKRAEIKSEELIYARGRIDGANEVVANIQYLSKYIREEDKK